MRVLGRGLEAHDRRSGRPIRSWVRTRKSRIDAETADTANAVTTNPFVISLLALSATSASFRGFRVCSQHQAMRKCGCLAADLRHTTAARAGQYAVGCERGSRGLTRRPRILQMLLQQILLS